MKSEDRLHRGDRVRLRTEPSVTGIIVAMDVGKGPFVIGEAPEAVRVAIYWEVQRRMQWFSVEQLHALELERAGVHRSPGSMCGNHDGELIPDPGKTCWLCYFTEVREGRREVEKLRAENERLRSALKKLDDHGTDGQPGEDK